MTRPHVGNHNRHCSLVSVAQRKQVHQQLFSAATHIRIDAHSCFRGNVQTRSSVFEPRLIVDRPGHTIHILEAGQRHQRNHVHCKHRLEHSFVRICCHFELQHAEFDHTRQRVRVRRKRSLVRRHRRQNAVRIVARHVVQVRVDVHVRHSSIVRHID